VRRSNKLLRSFQKWDSQREEGLPSEQNPITPPKITQAYESPDTLIQKQSSSRFNSLHALIIGIDKYIEEYNNLSGCEADARAVKDYLTRELNVPEENIVTLLSEAATRANIIDKIRGLVTDPSIQRDSPIVIFYAGLGSQAPAPEGWSPKSGIVKLICPHDYRNSLDRAVEGVPYRTLDVLLEELAKAKGDNIVRPLLNHMLPINRPK
jgi:hypothetical protein